MADGIDVLTCDDDIIICDGNQSGYTIKACNAGATTVFTNQSFSNSIGPRSLTINEWAGGLYQWGNKFDISLSTFSADKAACTNNSTYSEDLFRYGTADWCSNVTDNAWGSITGTVEARKGPCDNGYHVPSNTEWSSLISGGGWTGNGIIMMDKLKLPKAGNRGWGSTNLISSQGSTANYWTSTHNINNYVHIMSFSDGLLQSDANLYRAFGFSVRCFKN